MCSSDLVALGDEVPEVTLETSRSTRGWLAASLVGDLSDPAQHPSAAKTSTTHYLMHGLKRLLVRKGSPDFS